VAIITDRPRRPGRVARWITAGIAGLALVAGAGVAGGAAVHALDGQAAPTTSTSALATKATTGTVSAADIVAAVKPSVVTIAARSQGGTSEGSGVIVRSDGMIVTNYHVISGASGTITVTFDDGTTGTATVVASDPTNDLALLKVAGANGLTAISFGDSSSVAVGDDVIAIGNPLGLGVSATEGIVSALNRPVTIGADQSQGRGLGSGANSSVSYSAIQTDAAVNEGNSGGALVNTGDQLIGITSAIATSGTSTGNLGVAFAIPANQVHTFVNKALS
jgi:putative serine protease PepD